MDRVTLASLIDHTLLRPEATTPEVAALCLEATELGVAAVCVSPARLPLPPGALGPGIGVAAVCGFPSGAHHGAVKAAEAHRAVLDGATEVDVVIDLGAALDGDWVAVEADLQGVRDAITTATTLKVIVESAALGPALLADAARVAEAAGADYVKTSTGFHRGGGATVESVAALAAAVKGRLGVKASGGIRTTKQALTMLEAGATRLGCSATRAVLDGLEAGAQ